MAIIVGQADTWSTGTTNGVPSLMNLPVEYQVGDLLIGTIDGAYLSIPEAPAGWTTKHYFGSTYGTVRIFYKRAVANEPKPSFLFDSGRAFNCCMKAIRFAVATGDPFDGAIANQYQTSLWESSFPAYTPTQPNDLIIYGVGWYQGPARLQQDKVEHLRCNGVGYNYITEGYRQHATTDQVPAASFFMGNSAGSNGGTSWVYGIKDDGSGNTGAMAEGRPASLTKYSYSYGVALTARVPNYFANIPTIKGVPMSSSATGPSFTGMPTWYSFRGFVSNVTLSAATFPNGAWDGGFYQLTSDADLTNKVVALNIYYGTQWSASTHLDEGACVIFVDALNNWAAFQTHNLLEAAPSTGYTFFLPVDTITPYASSLTEVGCSGVAIDWTQVRHFGQFIHRRHTASGAFYLAFDLLRAFGAPVVFTGTRTGGMTVKDVYAAVMGNPKFVNGVTDQQGYGYATFQGAGQLTFLPSIQLGDGVRKTNIGFGAQSLELAPYDAKYNPLPTGRLEFRLKAGPEDVFDFSSAILNTSIRHKFIIDSGFSLLATALFSNASIVGWDVTWKTGVPCIGAAFSKGGIIDFKGADIERVIASAGADQALIKASDGFSATDCIFTASPTAIYGIRIDTAGTITLTDTSFTGFTKDIDITATSGVVTIATNGFTPTYQTAGASVEFIVASATLTIAATASLVGAEVRVYDLDGTGNSLGTELTGTESCPTATFDYSGAGGNVVWIQILKAGYKEFGQQFTLPSTSSTFTAVLEPDGNA